MGGLHLFKSNHLKVMDIKPIQDDQILLLCNIFQIKCYSVMIIVSRDHVYLVDLLAGFFKKLTFKMFSLSFQKKSCMK